MKKINTVKSGKYRIVFFVLMLAYAIVIPAGASAQYGKDTTWRIKSPLPGSTVKSGELFIVVMLDEKIEMRSASLNIYIDRELVSYDAKVEGNRISMIYFEPLKPGKHTISVYAKDEFNYKIQPIRWSFNIESPNPAKPDSNWNKLDLYGNLYVDARKEFLSGPGAALRQEPSNTTNLNFAGGLKYRRLYIPVKIFGTSDQNENFQSRNFFQAGIKYRSVEAYFGDLNPVFDRLILSGQRIYGGMASVKLGRFGLHAVHGNLQRSVEGSLQKFTPNGELPPINQQSDSTFVVPGTYRRKVSAVKLQMGDPVQGSTMGLMVLKSTDDTTSIKYGVQPKQNLVIGLDNSWVAKGFRLRVNAGYAISLVTNDISKGVISKEEIEKQFDVKSDYDPADYKDFIIINTTTTPLYVQKKSSNAFYVNGSYKVGINFISAEFRKIGGAYVSFGNPFIRNDINSLMISDRIYLFKKKVTATIRAQRYYNNLTNEIISKVLTRMINMSLMIAPSPKLPTLSLSYNTQDRSSFVNPLTNIGNVNDQLESIGAGGFHNFKLFKVRHYVSANYMRSERKDNIYKANGNITEMYMFSISQTYKKPIEITFQFQKMDIRAFDDVTLQNTTTITAQFKYSFIKQKAELTVSGADNFVAASVYQGAAQRPSGNIRLTYRKFKNMSMDMEFGTSPFYDRNFPMNNYGESYLLARYNYNFN